MLWFLPVLLLLNSHSYPWAWSSDGIQQATVSRPSLNLKLLSPSGETQFTGLHALEHECSSDCSQHGFFLTPAIPTLCGLSLWLSIANGDLILSCPTAISPLLCKGLAEPVLPEEICSSSPKSHTQTTALNCIGTIQTENLSQLVIVLQVSFLSKFFPSLPPNFMTILMRQTLSRLGTWKISGFLLNCIFHHLQSGTPCLCASDTKQRLAKTKQ